jgi:hypothetical protein
MKLALRKNRASTQRRNKMAQITVYDLDNQPHQKESVDANECVRQLGWTTHPKVVEKAAVEVDVPLFIDPPADHKAKK